MRCMSQPASIPAAVRPAQAARIGGVERKRHGVAVGVARLAGLGICADSVGVACGTVGRDRDGVEAVCAGVAVFILRLSKFTFSPSVGSVPRIWLVDFALLALSKI